MPIRAITFDFWRTLFHEAKDPEQRRLIRIRAVCEATGASPESARAALQTSEREFMQHHIELQRTLGPEDAVRIVMREVGVKLSPEVQQHLAEVFATAILHFPPIPIDGALDAVAAAAKRGPVGVISDSGLSPGSSLRTLLERNGFLPFFDSVVFSDEVGVSKPHARMFDTCAQGLGVAPSELLHIGDLETTDVVGAKAVGARAALFAGDNDRHVANTTADYVFKHWRDFLEVLPDLT
ncbi:MAG: HAD family hydrolase [Candidatus Hydrogenedentes bacterium]|nr:HAD family hydrolase [Candidatus Hydrogenedentota bacterium]